MAISAELREIGNRGHGPMLYLHCSIYDELVTDNDSEGHQRHRQRNS